MNLIHNCRYSKALFQSYPRACLVCGQPEFEVPKEDVPQQNDEKGNPLTYWGGKQNDVREDDVDKLAEQEYPNIGGTFQEALIRFSRSGFVRGYNKAKENTYTEEQLLDALKYWSDLLDMDYPKREQINKIIQSLKQTK